MELTKKQTIWGIILFGTLIGLNETVIGGLHIQYKSVILSTITISLLSYARYKIPRPGTSFIIILIAVLFKLTDLGVYFCKPAMLVILGIGFELFASFLIRSNNSKLSGYLSTCFLTSIVTFTIFAFFERYVVGNEYWVSEKFNDYIFVKAPLTAVFSTLLTITGLLSIRQLKPGFIDSLVKKPVQSQLILGFLIVAMWIAGYITANYQIS